MTQMTTMQVSVTRRSAGLPLAILSILTALGRNYEHIFSNTVERLFAIGSGESDESRHEHVDLAQVHALNILKYVNLMSFQF